MSHSSCAENMHNSIGHWVLLAWSIAVMSVASAMLVGVKLGLVTGTWSSPEHLRAPPPLGC
jgi:hypothetical protein